MILPSPETFPTLRSARLISPTRRAAHPGETHARLPRPTCRTQHGPTIRRAPRFAEDPGPPLAGGTRRLDSADLQLCQQASSAHPGCGADTEAGLAGASLSRRARLSAAVTNRRRGDTARSGLPASARVRETRARSSRLSPIVTATTGPAARTNCQINPSARHWMSACGRAIGPRERVRQRGPLPTPSVPRYGSRLGCGPPVHRCRMSSCQVPSLVRVRVVAALVRAARWGSLLAVRWARAARRTSRADERASASRTHSSTCWLAIRMARLGSADYRVHEFLLCGDADGGGTPVRGTWPARGLWPGHW